MWGLLAPLIGTLGRGLLNAFTTYMERSRQEKEMRHRVTMAVELQKAKLASDKENFNTIWALEQLKHTDRWLRRVSYILFTLPFVVGAFDPMMVQYYFTNVLAAVPEWYIYTYVGMVAAIWGFRGMGKFLTGRKTKLN